MFGGPVGWCALVWACQEVIILTAKGVFVVFHLLTQGKSGSLIWGVEEGVHLHLCPKPLNT